MVAPINLPFVFLDLIAEGDEIYVERVLNCHGCHMELERVLSKAYIPSI